MNANTTATPTPAHLSASTGKARQSRASRAPRQAIDPIICRPADAASALAIGVSTLYDWASDGRMGPERVKVGGVVGYIYREVFAWVIAGTPPRHIWRNTKPAEFRRPACSL